MTGLWLWPLAIMATLAVGVLCYKNRVPAQVAVIIVATPLMVPIIWPMAQEFTQSLEPLEASEIDVGPCPGVVAYKEMRETSRKSVRDITAAFILNGWGNITVQERGRDGFWSSTYSVVAARCPSTAEAEVKP